MDFKRLSSKAKDLIDKRGGTDSVKQDADELKNIAQGKGSLTDKAKAAAEAIKEPGSGPAQAPAAEAASPPERERAGAKVDGEKRGKHAVGAGGEHGRGGKGGGKRRAKRAAEGRGGDSDRV